MHVSYRLPLAEQEAAVVIVQAQVQPYKGISDPLRVALRFSSILR